ncbi:MAG: cytoplasmic protein [Kouleothrix sp.]|jgi:uncharacterized membrane protein|nr:cytoplasmic protein [Kouleothrix sp.]
MARALRVLLAGESWETLSFHQKGFDVFTTTFYYEGAGPLRAALEAAGATIEYMPSHIAATKFPTDRAGLAAFDVVILSDIGSNTLLLHPDTFERSRPMPNRLALLRDYVAGGGGLIMVGGYMTFQGIDAKARYAGTPVEDALPVTLLRGDDRVEVPEGAVPHVLAAQHPIVAGLEGAWPQLLGYNRLAARLEATTIASVAADPLLVAWAFGAGRAVAFASDCGPHWAPPEFLAWSGYARLWSQMVAWAGGAV